MIKFHAIFQGVKANKKEIAQLAIKLCDSPDALAKLIKASPKPFYAFVSRTLLEQNRLVDARELAVAFEQATDVTEAEKKIAEAIPGFLKANDITSAEKYALALPAGEQRDAFLRDICVAWAKKGDIVAACRLVSSIEDPIKQRLLIEGLKNKIRAPAANRCS